MQPRTLLIGTYGCDRCPKPAGTGGQHENFPQPRVVGRVARSGPRSLGHGRRPCRRDRAPPRPEAASRHPLCPPAASTGADPCAVANGQPGAVTNGQPSAVASAQPGTVANGQPGTVANARSHALSGTVAGGHAETVT
jgi:hypothetical protein